MITRRPNHVDNCITGISTTLSNVLQLRDFHSFLHVDTATVVDTTGMSTNWSEKKRAATVGSRLSPTLNAHRGPAQQTSITLSMYCNCRISGKTDHGNLRLRHARDVDNLDMHNNRHVNQVHNAQFETVRTRLCCITAIPSSVEDLKRASTTTKSMNWI